jgi:hypothetical protein
MAKPELRDLFVNRSNGDCYYEGGKQTLNPMIFKHGSGTIGGPGTVTVTDTSVATTSIIMLTNTLGARALAVTTTSDGSFIVTGTAADTFDYFVIV